MLKSKKFILSLFAVAIVGASIIYKTVHGSDVSGLLTTLCILVGAYHGANVTQAIKEKK